MTRTNREEYTIVAPNPGPDARRPFRGRTAAAAPNSAAKATSHAAARGAGSAISGASTYGTDWINGLNIE